MKQCFKYGSSHNGLTRTSHSRQRESTLIVLIMPVTASFPEIYQRITHSIALVVFESEFHSVNSPQVKLKLVRYDSYKRTDSTPFGRRLVTARSGGHRQ